MMSAHFRDICRLQDHPHSGVRCGPHRTVRTAPALIGQKSPHHHDFRTFFEHYFRQVYLVVQYIFLQSKKKKHFWALFFQAIQSYKYLISVKSKDLIMYTT